MENKLKLINNKVCIVEKKSAATEIFEIMKEMPEYKSQLVDQELEDAANDAIEFALDLTKGKWTRNYIEEEYKLWQQSKNK